MKTLTVENCRRLLLEVEKRTSKRTQATDRGLLLALLTCGADARTWTWQDVLELFLDMPYPTYENVKQIAIAKQLTIFPFNHVRFSEAHWVHGSKLEDAVFTIGTKPLTTQEVTRRMKRYARLAGIATESVSLRTLVNTHNLLMNVYGNADEIADVLGVRREPVVSSFRPVVRKAAVRLHGIGRRAGRLQA